MASQMSPKDYELLAKRTIQRAIDYEGLERKAIQVYHLKEYVGRSGHKYKIDISYEFTLMGIKHLVIFECRFYKSKIKRSQVSDFAYVVDDLGASRGVIVTTIGFQRGAKTIARSSRVDFALLNPVKELLYIFHPGLIVRVRYISQPSLEDYFTYYSSVLVSSMEFSFGFFDKLTMIARKAGCFWCLSGTMKRVNIRTVGVPDPH